MQYVSATGGDMTIMFRSTIDCARCDAPIKLKLSYNDEAGREDYWLYDGSVLVCTACGCHNDVRTNDDEGAWLVDPEET
jgi:hypothetical protein